MIQDIETHTANGEKYLPVYSVNIRDDRNQVVARVRKTLYIRRKDQG